jgi:hypothetical protein
MAVDLRGEADARAFTDGEPTLGLQIEEMTSYSSDHNRGVVSQIKDIAPPAFRRIGGELLPNAWFTSHSRADARRLFGVDVLDTRHELLYPILESQRMYQSSCHPEPRGVHEIPSTGQDDGSDFRGVPGRASDR